MIHAVSVCIFETNKANARLLALQRSTNADAFAGLWEVVSGRVHKGESIQETALREIAEETNVKISLHSKVVDQYQAMRANAPMQVYVFAAYAHHNRVVLSEEHDAYQWLSLSEFAERCPFARLIQAAQRCAAIYP